MEKLDLTKRYKAYYKASAKPEQINIEDSQFLSIIGVGDPSAKAYEENIRVLYATAYTVKFLCKARTQDFIVPKLEGL